MAHAVTFQLIGQLDTASLNAGVPGSVAAYGNDVYVGGLFGGGQLHHITNPLTSPANIATFGGGAPLPGNGYVNLNTDGTTLVAATNNGGSVADVVQVYTFGTDSLNWASDSAALGLTGADGDRIDGAAVDPKTGEVLITSFGSGTQKLYLPNGPVTPGTADLTPSTLFDSGIGTGWRDIDYNEANGDIYLRAIRGIGKGVRNGVTTHDYTRPDGFGAGVQTIVNLNDNFDSAINIEYLPASFAGQEALIVNRRGNPDTFADQIEIYDPNGFETELPVTFLDVDGVTPFTTVAASSGIYDFSYDPVNELLYVSDFSTSQIHIFGIPGNTVMGDGDYNNDGTVNAADYTVWRDTLGQSVANGTGADGDGNGTVEVGDYQFWKDRFGNNVGSGGGAGAVAGIPEPATILTASLAFAAGLVLSRRRSEQVQ